jgi:hypothetical protein
VVTDTTNYRKKGFGSGGGNNHCGRERDIDGMTTASGEAWTVELEDFLRSLAATADTMDALEDFCRRRLIHGTPYVFAGREEEFYEFRKRIATQWDADYSDVHILGSARLGFSPHKRTEFSFDSDIDVAIVSEPLFDGFMDIIREYQMELRRNRRAVSNPELDTYHTFLEYVALGWIRPDKLPLSFQLKDRKDNWFSFFNRISHGRSEVGNYKVTAGVFKSMRHLELYQISGLEEIKTSLQLGTTR